MGVRAYEIITTRSGSMGYPAKCAGNPCAGCWKHPRKSGRHARRGPSWRCRTLFEVTVAAQGLQRARENRLGRLGGDQLGHRRLLSGTADPAPFWHKRISAVGARRTGQGERPWSGLHFIVGMTKLESVTVPLAGQRWVTVFTFVKKRTPSSPCWFMSPKALRFHPPKLW